MGGLQAPTLGMNILYAVAKVTFIQIVIISSNHWITISNGNSQSNHVIVIYVTKHSGNFPTEAQEQIAALISSTEKDFTIIFQPVQVPMGAVYVLSLCRISLCWY